MPIRILFILAIVILASCGSDEEPAAPESGGAFLFPEPVLIDDDPSWSTDGTKILYLHYGAVEITDAGKAHYDLTQAGLWIAGTDGAEPKMLLNGLFLEGRFANTQSLVAVQLGDVIFRYRLEGDSLVDATPLAEYGRNFNPSWSRDDARIVYESNLNGTYEVWQMKADGSEKRVIPLDWETRVSYVDWFPSGDRVIACVLSPAFDFDLATFDTTGSLLGYVARSDADEMHARVSPDGSRIAFERLGYVWIVGADGRNARKLVFGRRPTWSPDGQSIAYVTHEGPPGEASTIWIVNVNEGTRRPLTYGP